MDSPLTPAPTGAPKVEEPKPATEKVKISKKLSMKKVVKVLVALLLLAGSAYGGYYWRDRSAKSDSKSQQSKIDTLNTKVADLEKPSTATSTTGTTETSVSPTAAQLTSIEESISSGNTAALQGRMATSVTVIIAASEGMGARTEAQAISDLDTVVDLTATWDFNLSAATLAGYASGNYAQYFPEGALVGKSSTGKVVSFIFDANAKIKTIFMSASSDLL